MVAIIKKLFFIMNRKQRWKSVRIICLQIIGSFLELLGVTMILPFISAIINPMELKDNVIFREILSFLHIDGIENIILIMGILVIGVYCFKNVFLVLIAHIVCKFSTNTQKDICMELMRSYMHRDYVFFTRVNSMELIRGVSSDANSVMAAISISFKLFADVMTIGIILVYLLFLDILFAVTMSLLVLLCVCIFINVFKKRIKIAGEEHVKYNSLSLKYANQAFNGIKEIIVKQKSNFFVETYEDVRVGVANAVYKHNFLEKVPTYLFEMVCVIGLIGIIYVKMLMGEKLDEFIPMLAVFAVSVFRILPLTSKVSSSINSLFYYKEALDITCKNIKDLRSYIVEKESIEENEASLVFDKEIVISNVYWKYPQNNNNILENVNFVIKKGDSIAFIGPSGAGKTTLADIILGLFKPQQGDVLVDGKSIFQNIKSWSGIIQYVPQAVYLIDDTIRKNIAFGIKDEYIKDDCIWNALKMAQLDDYVMSLPQGLDTVVGERGIRLSGGQRQRIAIARALYDNPEIVVFDEATSALDTETETAIMQAIDHLKGIKTLIIVAHRLSTIKNCDHIYEVDGKRVIETSIL